MKNLNQVIVFLIRWVLTSLGLWACVRLFGESNHGSIVTYLLAGMIFSLVNSIVKPLATLFSLPVILLTMGVFTLVVNGLMVYLTILLTPGLELPFWSAIIAGIVMAIVNYVVNVTFQSYNDRHGSR